MSGYVRNVVVKTKFENDEVTIRLRPISFEHMLSFAKLKDTRNEEDVAPALAVMKGYTEAVSGLKADDGTDVTIEEMYGSAYFLPLVLEVLQQWLAKAVPSDPSSPAASQAV